MTKVSFDFDGTLTKEEVQYYAALCIEYGHEVWVHTARIYSTGSEELPDWLHSPDHKDLWDVVDKIGIPRDQVVFCNMADKAEFLEGFLWHLDDDWLELEKIEQSPIKCVGLDVKIGGWWKAAATLLYPPPKELTISFNFHKNWFNTPAHKAFDGLNGDGMSDMYIAGAFAMMSVKSAESGDSND